MTAHPPRPLPAYNPSQPVLPAKFKCALQSRAHETLQVWPLPALPALSPLLPHRTSSLPRPTGLSMLVPWTQALPIPWSVYEFTYEDLGQMAPLRISPFRDECPRLPSLMHCSLLSCPSCVFMCTCPPPLRPHATVAMCYSSECARVLSRFSHVWLFATLMDCSTQTPLSIGILQTKILERAAVPSSKGSSQPRDLTHNSSLLH